MADKEHLQKIQEKLGKILQTPYLDHKGIKNVVDAFERFVNPFDGGELLAAAADLATDTYAQEYMAEHGLTMPKDEADALDRHLIGIGEGVATMHRTLQQNFMRVVLAFIEIQAAFYEAEMFDLRNEDTTRLCKVLWDAIKDRDDVFLRFV